MAQQKALFVTVKHGPFAVGTKLIPRPGPGEVLIKVHTAALNPADAILHAEGDRLPSYPAILGCEFSGAVEEIGEGVANLQIGDRVVTEVELDGDAYNYFASQQYALGKADLTAKVPPNISFDQAATLPVGIAAAILGLYNSLGIVPPWGPEGKKFENKPIFVYGGSASNGQYAIQFAKLSGFNPIVATASPANAAWLKELGATQVIDRNLSAEEIKVEVGKITTEPIEVVYDAISRPETQQLSYDILTPGGPGLLIVNPDQVKDKVPDKRVVWVFGFVHAPENRALGVQLYSRLTFLLETGQIKPNQVEVLPNGLEGIPAGLERLTRGVSNVKLVAHPQETP